MWARGGHAKFGWPAWPSNTFAHFCRVRAYGLVNAAKILTEFIKPPCAQIVGSRSTMRIRADPIRVFVPSLARIWRGQPQNTASTSLKKVGIGFEIPSIVLSVLKPSESEVATSPA